MTFRRTEAGLSNLHIFAGVDVIVFTEGGGGGVTYSVAAAARGGHSATGHDVMFWSALFALLRSDLRVHVRALGSRKPLDEIAQLVKSDAVSGVVVAKDRDYDRKFGRFLRHPNVLYTYGYSWENDLYDARLVVRTFFFLSYLDPRRSKVKGDVRSIFDDCDRHLRWAVRADALMCVGGSSLFDRDNPRRFIGTNGHRPYIRIDQMRRQCRLKRSEIGKFHCISGLGKFNVQRDCFGKLLSELSYRILFYLIKKHTHLPSLAKSYAITILMNQFFEMIRDNENKIKRKYYLTELKKVVS